MEIGSLVPIFVTFPVSLDLLPHFGSGESRRQPEVSRPTFHARCPRPPIIGRRERMGTTASVSLELCIYLSEQRNVKETCVIKTELD
jgi:hypothetical protein